MDAADLRAHARGVACVQGHRWLGPRACVRIRTVRRRRRARAQRLLRGWVSAVAAVDDVPAYATWMLSADVPGADRALAWFRDAIELPLARDSWRTSEDRLIAASIAHHTALDEESQQAAAVAAEESQQAAAVAAAAKRQEHIKAIFQASEAQDLFTLEVDDLCRRKRVEDWDDLLFVLGHAAVQKYNFLDDVPQSILLHPPPGGGSHGCGGVGSSWGPQLSRPRRFAFRRFHDNVAPYAPAHAGISSMRLSPDLSSSTVGARLTSRPNPAGPVEI